MRKTELTDGLVELLIQLVHKISVRAERKVENEISADFRRVHGKNGILVRLAQAALDLPEEVVTPRALPRFAYSRRRCRRWRPCSASTCCSCWRPEHRSRWSRCARDWG